MSQIHETDNDNRRVNQRDSDNPNHRVVVPAGRRFDLKPPFARSAIPIRRAASVSAEPNVATRIGVSNGHQRQTHYEAVLSTCASPSSRK